jgi:hypothetical protein
VSWIKKLNDEKLLWVRFDNVTFAQNWLGVFIQKKCCKETLIEDDQAKK